MERREIDREIECSASGGEEANNKRLPLSLVSCHAKVLLLCLRYGRGKPPCDRRSAILHFRSFALSLFRSFVVSLFRYFALSLFRWHHCSYHQRSRHRSISIKTMPSRHAVSIDVVLECPPHASLHRVIDLTTINEDFTVAISNAIARALHNRRVTIDAALPFRWLGVSYLVRVAAIEPMPLHRSRPIRIRSCRAIQQLDDDDDSDEDDGYADDADTATDRYSRRTTSASDSALEQPLTRINLLNSKNSPNDRYLSIESNRVSSTAADSATASSPSPSSSLSFLTLKRDAQVVGCTQQLASLNRLFGAALLQHKLVCVCVACAPYTHMTCSNTPTHRFS